MSEIEKYLKTKLAPVEKTEIDFHENCKDLDLIYDKLYSN